LISSWLSPASSLALRELEAAAGLGAAILLTFDDAAVARQEAFGLDRTAERRFIFAERLGNAMLHGAGLPRQTATFNGRDHVILAFTLSDAEGLVDDKSQRGPREIDFLIATVDRNFAGAGLHPDASDSILTAAG